MINLTDIVSMGLLAICSIIGLVLLVGFCNRYWRGLSIRKGDLAVLVVGFSLVSINSIQSVNAFGVVIELRAQLAKSAEERERIAKIVGSENVVEGVESLAADALASGNGSILANIDVPNLQAKIDELTKQCDVLTAEKQDLWNQVQAFQDMHTPFDSAGVADPASPDAPGEL